MRRVIVLLPLLLASCASELEVTTPSTTTIPQSETVTTAPPTTSSSFEVQREPHSLIRQLDPATLRPVGPTIRIDGYVGDQAVVLPDGRILLLAFELDWSTGETEDWRVVRFDPVNRQVATVKAPVRDGLRFVGYSPTLDGVIVQAYVGETPPGVLALDPVRMAFADEPIFQLDEIGWPHELALFDNGRKVAFYVTRGYEESHVGEPPEVWIGDLATGGLTGPVPIPGVIHGNAHLAPEMIRNPEWPYGTVQPGIAFDSERGMVHVVHGDARGLTVVNLHTARSEVHFFESPPTIWTSLVSWLIPPAQAKGNDPSADLLAWLSSDGSRLFVTGETSDAWRDDENRLHTTNSGLGLLVIDTHTFELIRHLDLPISNALVADQGIAVTGWRGNDIWCDEVCTPGNNEPEVTGDSENLGLLVLDPDTLEVRIQREPGNWVHLSGVVDGWLLVEISTEDDWTVESINMTTGQSGGRWESSANAFLLVTETGLFEVETVE